MSYGGYVNLTARKRVLGRDSRVDAFHLGGAGAPAHASYRKAASQFLYNFPSQGGQGLQTLGHWPGQGET